MNEILFPFHCLAIAGLVVFAALRGGSFPFKLAAMYAAFFYTSTTFQLLELAPEFQIVTAFIFASILFKFCIDSKRRLYVDLFCLLMILAIINYILLYVSYIALSGNAYEAASHLYTVVHVLLSISDIVILIGVVNGSRSDRAYTGLVSFISNGLSGAFLLLQAPQEAKGTARQTKTQKGNSINV
ncbi:MAG: hypothetical protein JKX72_02550 [Robiginitomaculum sp.]|nr:hypothetical protein [Robiginitomaculum sp.]